MSSFASTSRPTGTGATGDDTSLSETPSLIAASKVTGTTVYNRQAEQIGSIYDVMLDKRSGRVEYAIMSFGGFLGLGEHYHPLPWNLLHYDPRQGGYIVDIDRDRLRGAPAYATTAAPDWSNGAFGKQVDDYYAGAPTLRPL